jgi:hypothetical protein
MELVFYLYLTKELTCSSCGLYLAQSQRVFINDDNNQTNTDTNEAGRVRRAKGARLTCVFLKSEAR